MAAPPVSEHSFDELSQKSHTRGFAGANPGTAARGEASQRDGNERQFLHGSVDRLTLEKAITGLPPGYRIIFVLHDIEGYEHNEIAEMMSCSIGNSKSQLRKARMKLRTLLSGRNEMAISQLATA